MDRYYIIVTPIPSLKTPKTSTPPRLGFNPSENLFEIARVESKIVQRFQLLEAGESAE